MAECGSETTGSPLYSFLPKSGLTELQMGVGQNVYWFRSNSRKTHCFEKDINSLTEWTGKGLFSFYSAIDPWQASLPILFSKDLELLHKAVEKAQLDGNATSHFCNLLQRNMMCAPPHWEEPMY